MIKARELRIGNCVFDNVIKRVVYVDPNIIRDVYLIELAGKVKDNISAIGLSPEMLQSAGFEDWGEEVVNEWETHHNYVLHNVIEGTSSIKVCFVNGNYGSFGPYSEWVFKIDNDIIYNKGLEYLHQLQNIIFALTYQELVINLQTIPK